ncbi:MAG: hypothetical protein ACQKBV_07230 [Puniceicoccales bacterium]
MAKAGQGPLDPFTLTPQTLSQVQFETLDFDSWEWAGPCVLSTQANDTLPLLGVSLTPDLNPESAAWEKIVTPRQYFDFHPLFPSNRPAVAYVRGGITSETGGAVFREVQVDYYAKVWLIGELISVIDSGHGNPMDCVYVPAILKAGSNKLVVKVTAGIDEPEFKNSNKYLIYQLTENH